MAAIVVVGTACATPYRLRATTQVGDACIAVCRRDPAGPPLADCAGACPDVVHEERACDEIDHRGDQQCVDREGASLRPLVTVAAVAGIVTALYIGRWLLLFGGI